MFFKARKFFITPIFLILIMLGGIFRAGPVQAANVFPIFKPYVNFPVGSGKAVGIGDFNSDGLPDVAVTTSTQLMVFLQNQDGSLANVTAYAAGSRPESLAVGDVNGDGKTDIVAANYDSNTISVFLQQAEGLFAARVTYVTNSGPDAVAIGDINNDGSADIVVSHWTAANVGVFLQNSPGAIGPMITYPSPQAGYDDIAIADINHDGKNDVIKMNGQGLNPNLSVYIQNENGTLASAVSYSVTDCGSFCLSHGIGTGDVTGDGLTDIVISYGGNRSSSKIAVFAQSPDGSLQAPIAYNAYDLPRPVEVADVNRDGRADVLVAHDGWNALSVFIQQNNGTLSDYSLYAVPYSNYKPQGLAVGDLNQDGLSDVALADSSNGLVLLYQTLTPPNTPTPTITPTQTPVPIMRTISGNTGVGSALLYYSPPGTYVTSSKNGRYSLTVPSGWNGTIRPSLSGYRFIPESITYLNVQTDQQNQNFVAEPVLLISGNARMGGVTLSYEESGAMRTVITSSDGSYSFQVPKHWSGTVTPSKIGYIFSPSSRTYANVVSNLTEQDYSIVVTYTITGNAGVAGATLNYMDGISKSMTADDSGNYTIVVPKNWSGTITPSKANVTFSPVSRVYDLVKAGQTAQDYTATITVTNVADNGDSSLRQAITDATSGAIIKFDSLLSGQTIPLASEIAINKSLTLDGSGLNPRVEISGEGIVKIFVIGTGYGVHDLSIVLDSLILKNGRGFGQSYFNNGAAVLLAWSNTMTVKNTAFLSNVANGDGAAIYSDGNLTILQSEFLSNVSQGHLGGGAVYVGATGHLTVNDSTFTSNQAYVGGGAIAFDSGWDITIENTSFNNNTALAGGAISVENSSGTAVSIRNSLFSGNTSTDSYGSGGALRSVYDDTRAPNMIIENNTFFANQSAGFGGAISTGKGITLKNNTFSHNQANKSGASLHISGSVNTAVNVYNNIFANNTGGGECISIFANYNTHGNNNLVEDGSSACLPTIIGDPMLSPLADNGGLTQTMALLPGSPAIDAGDSTTCPSTDQRGIARPQGNGCDIGSFEYAISLIPTLTNTPVTPTYMPTTTPAPTLTPADTPVFTPTNSSTPTAIYTFIPTATITPGP